MEENDLHYTMKREEFNNVSKPVFAKLEEALVKIRNEIK